MPPTLVAESSTLKALVRLSLARGAGKFEEKEMQRAYLDGLSDQGPDAVREACENLAREPRAEYGPAMPTVGDIRQRIGFQARRRAELHAIKRAERLLNAPPEVSEERQAQLLRSLADLVKRRAWPKAGRGSE